MKKQSILIFLGILILLNLISAHEGPDKPHGMQPFDYLSSVTIFIILIAIIIFLIKKFKNNKKKKKKK